MIQISALTSLGARQFPATSRPNAPAFSAHIPTAANPASLSLPTAFRDLTVAKIPCRASRSRDISSASSILGVPKRQKQEDLKWLTTTSRNLRQTGRTASHTARGRAQGQARGAWGLSSSAPLSCSWCFTPSSGALPCRLNKTQAPSRPRLKCQHLPLTQHPRQRNNDQHSRLSHKGRGAIPAHKTVRGPIFSPHFELGGCVASATEVCPC